MASLRDTVKDYQDELRDGIAWVAFWKQGRSWNAEYFHLDMDDKNCITEGIIKVRTKAALRHETEQLTAPDTEDTEEGLVLNELE